MRRNNSRGGSPKGAKPNKPKNDRPGAENVQSQANKVKQLESKLINMLKSCDPENPKPSATAGGLDNRIDNISKLTDRLSNIIKKRDVPVKPVESTSGNSAHIPDLERATAATKGGTSRENCGEQPEAGRGDTPSPSKHSTLPTKKKKTNYVPLNLASILNSDYTKYFMLKITPSLKRKLNPYEILAAIAKKTGHKPKALTGYNALSYTIEVRDEDQGTKLGSTLKIEGSELDVCPHPFFNQTRGLIYVEDVQIDNVEEFQIFLKQKLENLTRITIAPFIKPRNPTTQVFILEFAQDNLPNSVYIPGERKDTTIYKLRNKPLMCNKCLQYGHPAKFCRPTSSQKCRRCANSGHDIADCTSTSPKCANCEGDHQAGHKDCPNHQREEKLVEIQQRCKVTARRARQILQNNNEHIQPIKTTYKTHFDIVMDKDLKRQFSPWLLEKSLTGTVGQKPKSIRSKNETTLTIEVSSEHQGNTLLALKTLNNIPIEVKTSNIGKLKKGLIYIYGYDVSDFPNFRESLKADLGVAEVELTPWIKPRNSLSQALLISFHDDTPQYITIPGEQAKTQVYPYKNRPQICKKCTNFFHGEKYCAGETRCARCSETGHRATTCNASPMKCPHCTGDHTAGNKDCPELKKQEEVLAIQSNEGVSRQQATILFLKNRPNANLNFAKALSSIPLIKPKTPTNANKPDKASTSSAAAKEAYQTAGPPKVAATETRAGSSNPTKTAPSIRTPKKKVKTIEIVCQSPSTGKIYKRTIEDPRRSPSPFDPDVDLTSENNPSVRSEAKRLFQEYDSDDDTDTTAIKPKRLKE